MNREKQQIAFYKTRIVLLVLFVLLLLYSLLQGMINIYARIDLMTLIIYSPFPTVLLLIDLLINGKSLHEDRLKCRRALSRLVLASEISLFLIGIFFIFLYFYIMGF